MYQGVNSSGATAPHRSTSWKCHVSSCQGLLDSPARCQALHLSSSPTTTSSLHLPPSPFLLLARLPPSLSACLSAPLSTVPAPPSPVLLFHLSLPLSLPALCAAFCNTCVPKVPLTASLYPPPALLIRTASPALRTCALVCCAHVSGTELPSSAVPCSCVNPHLFLSLPLPLSPSTLLPSAATGRLLFLHLHPGFVSPLCLPGCFSPPSAANTVLCICLRVSFLTSPIALLRSVSPPLAPLFLTVWLCQSYCVPYLCHCGPCFRHSLFPCLRHCVLYVRHCALALHFHKPCTLSVCSGDDAPV